MNECEGGNEHESDMMRRKYKTFGSVQVRISMGRIFKGPVP